MRFQKILIAVDTEPVAVHAAETGVDLAQALGAEVAFVHVVGSELDAKKVATAIRQRLSPQSSALEFIQVGGSSEEIIKAAEAWGADLIVIGSHGRTGVQRVFFGSVAEAVMRHAPCPVVVVRAKE
jgi:nucleotide-binding universal stress UspA family protein